MTPIEEHTYLLRRLESVRAYTFTRDPDLETLRIRTVIGDDEHPALAALLAAHHPVHEYRGQCLIPELCMGCKGIVRWADDCPVRATVLALLEAK